MANFKTGTATINSELEIVKADKRFYKYIGWENPTFLEQSVYNEDFSQLKSAAESVMSTGEQEMCTYRVQRPDGSLHCVIACIERSSVGEKFMTLNIQDVDSISDELSAMDDKIHELSAYMDIMDELFFRYDVHDDDFLLFMGGEKQRVRIFQGNLEMWENSFEDKKTLDEKYIEEYERLCGDLRQGTRHFVHEIMMPNLIRGDDKELYLFKGRSIFNSEGNLIVLGCVYMITQNSRRRKMRGGADLGKDELTGLLSKKTVTDYVKNYISDSRNANSYLCVLDIDNFKYVNDNLGHMFGDEVLLTVADIMKDAVGERGVVGRIGGDEMMIFLENIADRIDLKSILRTIRSNVEWAYKGVRDDINLSCSMGVAAWPADADNYDDLFKIADKMLYRAKENGKNRYIIYTREIHGPVLESDGAAPTNTVKPKNLTNIDKEHLIIELQENFLHRGMWGIQLVLEQTGIAFNLAEADVFYDEPAYTDMHWRADGNKASGNKPLYVGHTRFRQLFNNNNLAIINHTADLQFICPEAYEALNSQNVTAGLIYKMSGKVPGYICFFKEEKVSRMWPESDKNYLNFIGKMIELVISGK